MIRAKVVGKKLVKEGPFGTLVYTIKQMKVSDIITGPRRDFGGFARRVTAKGGQVVGTGIVCLLSVQSPASSRELLRHQEDMVAACSKASTGRDSHRSLLGS